jgi:hypothetical protein
MVELNVQNSVKENNMDEESYYSESLKWYLYKYVNNYIYVRYFFVFVIMFGISAFLIYQTSKVNSDQERYPIPIYFENEVDYFSNIKSIAYDGDNINIDVARYILMKFLKKSQNFDLNSVEPNNIQERLTFIKNLASLSVFQEYFKSIDIESNPETYLLKYMYSDTRYINIENIEFVNEDKVPASAMIYYTAKENLEGKMKDIKYKAHFKFFMSVVDKNFIESKKKFNFLITSFINERIE